MYALTVIPLVTDVLQALLMTVPSVYLPITIHIPRLIWNGIWKVVSVWLRVLLELGLMRMAVIRSVLPAKGLVCGAQPVPLVTVQDAATTPERF
jgi:hypothetical protein